MTRLTFNCITRRSFGCKLRFASFAQHSLVVRQSLEYFWKYGLLSLLVIPGSSITKIGMITCLIMMTSPLRNRWHELAGCGGRCDKMVWKQVQWHRRRSGKKLEHRFKFQGKILRLEKRRAGGTPERDVGLGRSARSRRVRAAPGFTPSEEQLTRHCTGRRFRFVSLPPVSLVVRRHQCYS